MSRPDPYVHKESYRQGFLDGYDCVTKIIELVVQKRSHLNPSVCRILNIAFTAALETLKEQRSNVNDLISQTPVERIHQTLDRR